MATLVGRRPRLALGAVFTRALPAHLLVSAEEGREPGRCSPIVVSRALSRTADAACSSTSNSSTATCRESGTDKLQTFA